jgi:hypothetical protein
MPRTFALKFPKKGSNLRFEKLKKSSKKAQKKLKKSSKKAQKNMNFFEKTIFLSY